MELLILAAGMGSRYGGLKQIEPIDEFGNFIIDYSIYDAIQAGFKKVILVIKEENYDDFYNTIGKRVEGKIEIEYVFQKTEDIPIKDEKKVYRKKPWGTGHAIMSARNAICDDFLVINSDDFYGRESFVLAHSFLSKKNQNITNEYANIVYEIQNTLTENGAVKRGVCLVENEYLNEIIESIIEKESGSIVAAPINDVKEKKPVFPTQLVSMNMFAFRKEFMAFLEEEFLSFYNANNKNITENEFLTPDIISSLIKKGKIKVKAIKTNAKWQGVTYSKDKTKVVNEIKKLVEKGEYKKGLWY
jgi:dTDP-glucose pyrophosphorylase